MTDFKKTYMKKTYKKKLKTYMSIYAITLVKYLIYFNFKKQYLTA